MSWSIQYPSREAFVLDQRGPASSTDLSDAANEQVVAVRDAVTLLIERGVVGPEGKDFTISINGHANPGHLPSSGWANDCVGLYINQK